MATGIFMNYFSSLFVRNSHIDDGFWQRLFCLLNLRQIFVLMGNNITRIKIMPAQVIIMFIIIQKPPLIRFILIAENTNFSCGFNSKWFSTIITIENRACRIFYDEVKLVLVVHL